MDNLPQGQQNYGGIQQTRSPAPEYNNVDYSNGQAQIPYPQMSRSPSQTRYMDSRSGSISNQKMQYDMMGGLGRNNSVGSQNGQHLPPRGDLSKEEKEIQFSDFDSDAASSHGSAHGHGHGKDATHDHHGHAIPVNGKLAFRDRLKHFTFAWYAWTMATGGVAFTMSVIPFRFTGLTGLGTAMFVLNLFFFTAVTSLLIARFILHPGTLYQSLVNPHEGFFMATFWLTVATMITNTTAYGIPNSGPWLVEALRIAFWVYTILVSIVAVAYYHVLFTVKALVITNVLPGWILPIFPAMLVGTLASAIAKSQTAEHALPMLICGLSYQGLGMMLALMMYPIYFGRLMTSGLPADQSRPAMYIAVGPPSFTGLALIGMAQDVKITKIFSTYLKLPNIDNPGMIEDLFQLLALLAAIGLWVFAAWCFCIAIVAMFEAIHRNNFHLNWYAKVFPNVGFTLVTINIGTRLNSSAILMVGTAMAVMLFFAYLLVFFCHIKAVIKHDIMWPGKDEDAH
ncbi:hypothetical protein HYFRA_00004745 [Hymenoscyphus fraxineus]|uniref:Malic acid transport protein n=1 Tax=Hymenoscyphus fraxineus TaxID=746836 RepID=A0A9N9KK42_9HELO|nr:hypothetical protein HYFRA_00004745 [Hymenoscyphus fraxineus]